MAAHHGGCRSAAEVRWLQHRSLQKPASAHAGEPVAEHNDPFGLTVQMAFRLCSEAEAGGILVSGLVRELSGHDASRFVALGERHTKGFPARTPVFRFEW